MIPLYLTWKVLLIYVGFAYNSKLDFSEHYKVICGRANARTYQLFKGLTTKNKETLTKAYKIYIIPLVECGTTVFAPHKVKDIEAIEKVQNNFSRKVSSVMEDFCTPEYQNPKSEIVFWDYTHSGQEGS